MRQVGKMEGPEQIICSKLELEVEMTVIVDDHDFQSMH